MSLRMNQIPETERPYEKLLRYGPESLSNAELLAIVIKTGTRNETALDIAHKVLLLTDTLYDLSEVSIEELMKINGIGEVKAIQIKACCEISKRLNKKNNTTLEEISCPYDVANLFIEHIEICRR